MSNDSEIVALKAQLDAMWLVLSTAFVRGVPPDEIKVVADRLGHLMVDAQHNRESAQVGQYAKLLRARLLDESR